MLISFQTLEAFDTKKTFLEELEWMTVPFQTCGKNPFNRLLDLMLEAPALMRMSDQLAHFPTLQAKYEGAASLLTSLYHLEGRLLAFYSEFETLMIAPPYRETVTPPDELNTQDLFPIIYTFTDIRTAGIHALYWAVMLMLTVGITRLRPLVDYLQSQAATYGLSQIEELGVATPASEELDTPQTDSLPDLTFSTQPSTNGPSTSIPTTPSSTTTSSSSPLPAPYDPQDFTHWARQVCKTAPYCLGDDKNDLGLGAVTAPLHIVLETLSSFGDVYAPECQWIRAMLKRVQEKGMNIVEFLHGVAEES
jgi:hypothetical protein